MLPALLRRTRRPGIVAVAFAVLLPLSACGSSSGIVTEGICTLGTVSPPTCRLSVCTAGIVTAGMVTSGSWVTFFPGPGSHLPACAPCTSPPVGVGDVLIWVLGVALDRPSVSCPSPTFTSPVLVQPTSVPMTATASAHLARETKRRTVPPRNYST